MKQSPSRCVLNWLSYSHINFFIWVKSPDLELLLHFRSYVFDLPLSRYRSGYEQVIVASIRVCTYLCADLQAAGGAVHTRRNLTISPPWWPINFYQTCMLILAEFQCRFEILAVILIYLQFEISRKSKYWPSYGHFWFWNLGESWTKTWQFHTQ